MKKLFILFLIVSFSSACSLKKQKSVTDEEEEIYYFTQNEDSRGPWITVELKAGDSFYYPLMAIWLEDIDDNYIQTLFVPESVATSIYRYGRVEEGHWTEGVRRWPQTLPYWAHKRNIKASDGLYMPDPESPVPDAYSGATPTTGFVLSARTDSIINRPLKVMLELNQNWDWNEFWTNDKFPGDEYYLRSCQPAVIYEGIIDPAMPELKVLMTAVGHSHPSGTTGEIFPDLGTLTTALDIADSIYVYIGKPE